MTEAPLRQYRDVVTPDFIDYNGHMNVGYYVVLFDRATDVMLDAIGLGAAYAERTNRSTFAVEAHVTYQRELVEGDPIAVETQILDHDAKRIHYFHRMLHAEEGYVAATLEQLSLHIDLDARRSVEMGPEELGRLAAIFERHGQLERPAEAGSVIGIRRKR